MKSKEDILNRLEDVEQVHRNHKRTYSIPRSDERQGLRPGQLAKLVFLAEHDLDEGARAERMWVEVQARAQGQYIGVLTNRPRYLKYVQQGDHVVFRAEHIAAIYVERKDPNWVDPEKYVVVSKKIMEDEAWPERAIHKEPYSDDSSGWLIMAKEDVGKYEDFAERFATVTAHDLLNKFPILDSVLGESIGTDWLWDEDDCEYKLVNDKAKSAEAQ